MPDLIGNKIVYYGFTGLIEQNGVTRICQAINGAINNNYDQIYLCMSSQGGLVGDGIFFYNHIKSVPIPVIVHNTGSVSSIATIVYVAGETRYCSAHSVFMMHPTTVGPLREGVPWERLKSMLSSAVADDNRTEAILRERTNLPNELLDNKRVNDVHLLPKQAVEFGLAHEIREFTVPAGHHVIQI